MDEQLRSIMVDVFGIAPADYRADLGPDDVDNWDSVTHLTLVMALEQSFGVSLQVAEATGMKSVTDIKRILAGKAGPAPCTERTSR